MLYRNSVTGDMVDFKSAISGGNWEPVAETKSQKTQKNKPKKDKPEVAEDISAEGVSEDGTVRVD